MVIDIEPLESPYTYLISFFDDVIYTIVTHDPDNVLNWISKIEWIHRRLIVGLDDEWSHSFSRNHNPVAILQLCVDAHALSTNSFTPPTSLNL
ncbi:hypothetical protein BUALT_Bualt04G0048100 [Buddleja alternifolia]|uniref:Uncharacterized protein n=1 Tax=Buddleja alternifolia TaxID=168488 RepID=A0AAV6XX91_9LAMI|nr:hypothetical protein BUALT_Bualt04G0048100 [Buddleja alternifolia]